LFISAYIREKFATGAALVTGIHRYLSKNESPVYSQAVSNWFLLGASYHGGLGSLFQIFGD